MTRFSRKLGPLYDEGMKKKHFWVEFTSDELAQAVRKETVAILPLAAVEQHGPHLPLGVDLYLVESFIQAGLKNAQAQDQVLVLPTLQMGISLEHADFVGTLDLDAQLMRAACLEMASAVARAGISRLLLFNSHGGNSGLMDIVGRQIRQETGLIVFHSNWYDLAEPEFMVKQFGQDELRFGVHAGDVETSLMMAIRPDLVGETRAHHASTAQAKAQQFAILGDGRSAKQSWMARDYSPTGAMGDARKSTPDKGARLLEHVGLRLIELTREIARFQV